MFKKMLMGLLLVGVSLTPAWASAQAPSGVCSVGAFTRWLAHVGLGEPPYTGDPFSAADDAYYEMLGGGIGCGFDFDEVVRWAQLYNVASGSWRDAGFDEACTLEEPFTRFWMAGHLIHHGVDFGAELPIGGGGATIRLHPAFHDSFLDYGPLTRGVRTSVCRGCGSWHEGYQSTFADSYELAGKWSKKGPSFFDIITLNWSSTRRVYSMCPLFDAVPFRVDEPPLGESSIGSRAGVLVHEAWHARYEGSQRMSKHLANPGPFLNTIPPTPDPERAPCQFEECDRYLGLYKRTPRGEMYHVRMMPYQAELHFQCDLLDSARDWVPLAVMEDMARSHAGLKESFINTPPFSCGVPTPLPGGGRRSALCPSIGNGPGVECTTEFECPPARGSSYPLCDKGCCTYRNVR